jgi:hypothetical protein
MLRRSESICVVLHDSAKIFIRTTVTDELRFTCVAAFINNGLPIHRYMCFTYKAFRGRE